MLLSGHPQLRKVADAHTTPRTGPKYVCPTRERTSSCDGLNSPCVRPGNGVYYRYIAQAPHGAISRQAQSLSRRAEEPGLVWGVARSRPLTILLPIWRGVVFAA